MMWLLSSSPAATRAWINPGLKARKPGSTPSPPLDAEEARVHDVDRRDCSPHTLALDLFEGQAGERAWGELLSRVAPLRLSLRAGTVPQLRQQRPLRPQLQRAGSRSCSAPAARLCGQRPAARARFDSGIFGHISGSR